VIEKKLYGFVLRLDGYLFSYEKALSFGVQLTMGPMQMKGLFLAEEDAMVFAQEVVERIDFYDLDGLQELKYLIPFI
jgi:hypothetical protein